MISSLILASFCLFAVGMSAKPLASGETATSSQGPLPLALGSPINVEKEDDCLVKVLAWEYAKKLLPRFGDNEALFDALHVDTCNVTLKSGRKYAPHPLRYNTMPAVEDSVVLYVNPTNGSDKNPGTSSEPFKTIYTAVLNMRLKRHLIGGNPKGIIYLQPGRYYPAKPISLTADDSNLAIVGSGVDNTFISGAKEYKFDWKTYEYQMASLVKDVSIVDDTLIDVSVPGSSSGRARFVKIMINASDCRRACNADHSCFAYTWFDDYSGNYSNMCYFRTDGLWAPMKRTGAISGKKLNISVADLSGQNPTPFTTLFLNGRRAVRARYPNGNPETMGLHTFPTGYMDSAEKWVFHTTSLEAEEVHISAPIIDRNFYASYDIGIGGPVHMFDPPKSYWGVKNPIGGVPGLANAFQVPTGLVYRPDEEFALRSWQNPKTGVVHAFHGLHWGNWQFKIDDRHETNRTITWSEGGWQEARGCPYGQEWFVDNIFEELDAPGEWFYDETDQKLYLYPNGTNGLPDSGFGTVLQRLLNIRGTIDNPVYNITVANITFTQTEPTFFERYTVPSGGDWSIHRGGTVFVEGIDGFTMQQCLFDSPGGNGLFLSNYVRNAVIEANEFRYTGDSAIAALGSTELIDATSGNQPRGTRIINNLMHENGIYGKQSAAFFQSLTCQTVFDGNILFNGPRDGLNYNDNLGGGNELKNNLAFNFVRETADCGPFNFFDRVPYITKVYNEEPKLGPALSKISYNFIITNYHSIYPLDHDDGSSYWEDTNNFLVYGGYKNHIGHSKVTRGNIYVRPDAYHYNNREVFFGTWPYCAIDLDSVIGKSGWGEVWANNTCIINHPNVYNFTTCTCDPDKDITGLVPVTFNNHFYVPNTTLNIRCGKDDLTLAQYQDMERESGSKEHDFADGVDIIKEWGFKLFGLNYNY